MLLNCHKLVGPIRSMMMSLSRPYCAWPAFISFHCWRGHSVCQVAQLSLYSGNSDGSTRWSFSESPSGILSGNLMPSRWSVSCWAILATKSSHVYLTSSPFLSKASTSTSFDRLTLPQILPHDQHASRPGIISSDRLVILGLISTCKFCGLFEPSAVTSIVTTRSPTPSWSAARPTICRESCLLCPLPADSSSILSMTPCTNSDPISFGATSAAMELSIWSVGSTSSNVFGFTDCLFMEIIIAHLFEPSNEQRGLEPSSLQLKTTTEVVVWLEQLNFKWCSTSTYRGTTLSLVWF